MWISTGIVTVIGVVLGAATVIFARPLLSIFITDSPEAIELGIIRLRYICIPYFLCGIMDVAAGVIRGMGASLVPTIITVLGVCGVRLTWVYTVFQLPQFHTIDGLYICYAISWGVTCIAQVMLYFILRKKLNRKTQTI